MKKQSESDPIFRFFDPEKDNPSDQIKADIVIVIVSIPFVYYMFSTAARGFLADPSPARLLFGIPMIIAGLIGLKGAAERIREIILLTGRHHN